MLLVFTVHPSAMAKVMDKRLPAIKSRALREFIQVGLMAMQALPGLFQEGEKFIAANPGSGIKGRGFAKVREIAKLVIPFMVQIWMYLTPVVYGVGFIPENYRWLLMLNPMSGYIDGYRAAFLGKPFDWAAIGISAAFTLVLFAIGTTYFQRVERRFADII